MTAVSWPDVRHEYSKHEYSKEEDFLDTWKLFLPLGGSFPQLTPWFALSLAVLLGYWLYRVAAEAQRQRVPRVAWWALPGWIAMLFSQNVMQPQPVLFALGAAALLLAEFWPYAYRRAEARPPLTWPVLGLLLGASLLLSVGSSGQSQPVALLASLGALLAGVVGTLTYVFWPRPLPAKLGFGVRWRTVTVPEWPDLSVTLTTRGAELTNISHQTLELAGWSPVTVNGWLVVRDSQGQSMNTLRAGQTAFLPLPEYESGVRVWYSLKGEPDARVFRADWVPVQGQRSRVLN